MEHGRTRATIDVQAVEHNIGRLKRALSPGTRLCAVVKADAYGHGVAHAVNATQWADADWLAVVTAPEAERVRSLTDKPILTMGAHEGSHVDRALAANADVVVWDEGFLSSLPDSARVHVKLDTGMGRLGTRDPGTATRLAETAAQRGMLAGLMTHFATADERGDAFFEEQLARFGAWSAPLKQRFPQVLVHAANSAATLRAPASHFDMVRTGVAIYGLDPFGEDAIGQALLPALELTSWVAAVKPCRAGESAGYGRRFIADRDTIIATIPIGYGDGFSRANTNNGDVVIGGARYPIVGTVSMDNITVDLGPSTSVRVGDPAWLLGEGITAEEIARRLGTINYEVTCALLPRVERIAR